MRFSRYLRRPWPVAAKVPVAVAGLMIVVGIVLSQQVLAKLADTQEQFLNDLSQSYLDGLTSAIGPSVLREDNWEVFDAIERAQTSHRSLRPIETIVTNAENRIIAASDPHRHPIGAEFNESLPDGRVNFDPAGDVATISRVLAYPGRTAGAIFARFDTRHLATERRDVTLALALTNGILVLALAAAGWLMMWRMLQPVRILSDHLGAARMDEAKPIPETTIEGTHGEFRRLFRSYNDLVRSLGDRENLARRLAEERRISSLGRLASSVAHEINNPLGGLFNAVATLKSHGYLPGVRENSLGLLDRGLQAIKDTVRTTLSVYRTDRTPRALESHDLDDLALLVAPEAKRKGVNIKITNALETGLEIPSTPIRQALLNLILNAIAVTPPGGSVSVEARSDERDLTLNVDDEGPGLPAWAIPVLTDANALPPLDRSGLGLWTTSRLIADLGGIISVSRTALGGAAVRINIPKHDRELADVA